MYHLTLTPDERHAIDFVGHRYWHGDDLYRLLMVNCTCTVHHTNSYEPEDCSNAWGYSPYDITFHIPEHIAWDIKENTCDDEGRPTLDLFAPDLVQKIMNFCDSIV